MSLWDLQCNPRQYYTLWSLLKSMVLEGGSSVQNYIRGFQLHTRDLNRISLNSRKVNTWQGNNDLAGKIGSHANCSKLLSPSGTFNCGYCYISFRLYWINISRYAYNTCRHINSTANAPPLANRCCYASLLSVTPKSRWMKTVRIKPVTPLTG